MRVRLAALLLVAGVAARADWRDDMARVTALSPNKVTAADVTMLATAPCYAGIRPGDYENNIALLRRSASYLLMVEQMNKIPDVQRALGPALRNMAAWSWMAGFGGTCQPSTATKAAAPTPLSAPPEPKFALQAPDVPRAAGKEGADVQDRYELAAARASAAWRNVMELRARLQSQGLALNTQSEMSLARLQVYFDLSFDALKSGDMPGAKANIERGEYEAEKLNRTVGR